jgi:hypothetical protein
VGQCGEGGVEGTLHASSASVEHVRVDHGGLDAGVAEQFLDGANVIARLQQMRGEGVAKRVTGGAFGDPCPWRARCERNAVTSGDPMSRG